MKIKIKKLNENAKLPEYAHPGDAGMDLFACEDLSLKPGERGLVGTGLAFEIPFGSELQIRPRSGLAIKNGISLVNSPGTLDCGYRGELKIILINHGDKDFEVRGGDKIEQGVLNKVEAGEIEIVDELSETSRGEGGFGSTGTRNKERPLAVVISALINDGKILLIKRIKGDFVGLWGLPGGKVEKEEFLEEAALREIEEETGIKSEFKEHLSVVSEHIIEDTEKKHFILHVCELIPKSTEAIQKNEGEVEWFDFVNIHERKHLIIPSDFLIIDKIVKNKEKNYFNSVIKKSGDEYVQMRFD